MALSILWMGFCEDHELHKSHRKLRLQQGLQGTQCEVTINLNKQFYTAVCSTQFFHQYYRRAQRMLQSLAEDYKILYPEANTEAEANSPKTNDVKETSDATVAIVSSESAVVPIKTSKEEQKTPNQQQEKNEEQEKKKQKQKQQEEQKESERTKQIEEKDKRPDSWYESTYNDYYAGDIRSEEFKAMSKKNSRRRSRSRSSTRRRSRSRSSSRVRSGSKTRGVKGKGKRTERADSDNDEEKRLSRSEAKRRTARSTGKNAQTPERKTRAKPTSKDERDNLRQDGKPRSDTAKATTTTPATTTTAMMSTSTTSTTTVTSNTTNTNDTATTVNNNIDNVYRKYSKYNRVIWGEPFIQVPAKEHMTMMMCQSPLLPDTPQLGDKASSHLTAEIKKTESSSLSASQEISIEKRFRTGLNDSPSPTQTYLKCTLCYL